MTTLRPFPIIEYARKIGKSTAEFTVNDLGAYMKWWMKQPIRKDILAMKLQYDNKKRMEAVQAEEQEEVVEIVEHGDEDAIVTGLELTQLEVDGLIWAIETALTDYTVDKKVETSLRAIQLALQSDVEA